jgi:hypothetical protein
MLCGSALSAHIRPVKEVSRLELVRPLQVRVPGQVPGELNLFPPATELPGVPKAGWEPPHRSQLCILQVQITAVDDVTLLPETFNEIQTFSELDYPLRVFRLGLENRSNLN